MGGRISIVSASHTLGNRRAAAYHGGLPFGVMTGQSHDK